MQLNAQKHLPSMYETLSLIPSTEEKENENNNNNDNRGRGDIRRLTG